MLLVGFILLGFEGRMSTDSTMNRVATAAARTKKDKTKKKDVRKERSSSKLMRFLGKGEVFDPATSAQRLHTCILQGDVEFVKHL